MGSTFFNCFAKTENKEKILEILEEIQFGRTIIGTPNNGWIPIFEETMEMYNMEVVDLIGKDISESLNTSVIFFSVFDDDVMIYYLYNNGKLIDSFNSFPDYEGEMDEEAEKMEGNVDVLLSLAINESFSEDIKKILNREDKDLFQLENERVSKLAKCIGINPEISIFGYNYFETFYYEKEFLSELGKKEEWTLL